MKFGSKKLNEEEIIRFNQQVMIESEWFIDRFGKLIMTELKL